MSAPPKSSSRLPLHLDSELCFVLPDFLAREFEYARSLEQGIMDNLHLNLRINIASRYDACALYAFYSAK